MMAAVVANAEYSFYESVSPGFASVADLGPGRSSVGIYNGLCKVFFRSLDHFFHLPQILSNISAS